jgi:hypothetical protein
VPVLAGVMAVVLLVVVVPDTSNTRTSTLPAPGESDPGAADSGTAPDGGASESPAALPSGSVPTGGSSSSLGPGAGPGTGSSPLATAPVRGGATVTGSGCRPGVRQFTWSPYAPMCAGHFSGSNGGATAHGVTGTTITLVMRKPSDWDSTAQALGQPSFASLAHDTQVLVNYFNSQYELYGRKVVVKTFNGQGSFFSEGANQGQASANADAQTAYDLGAFADGFPLATGTYADAEASRRIIHFAPANSEAAYQANAPYRFGFPAGAVNEVQGAGVAALICQRMAKLNAVFAGDAAYQGAPRKFAYVEAEQPDFAGGGAVLERALKACGVPIQGFKYSADVNSEAQQSVQIVGRLKDDDVSTVVMFTDPVMSQFMTASAGQQQYRPEWLFTVFPQSLARQADAGQMAHAIQVSPWHATTGSPSSRLCHRIYKRADPQGNPQSGAQGIDFVCSLLTGFFAGLQQAGPRLTPESFYNGWFQLPDSTASSDFGRWSFGPKKWSPAASFSVLQWNASARSDYDGGTGQWEHCAGPADYPYLRPKLGSGQLKCYGR